MRKETVAAWELGSLDLATENVVRVKRIQIEEIENLTLDNIKDFYADHMPPVPPTEEDQEDESERTE